jgi:hypothetical protein
MTRVGVTEALLPRLDVRARLERRGAGAVLQVVEVEKLQLRRPHERAIRHEVPSTFHRTTM